MTSNIQAVVALCAGTGFLIVWLVFPAKGTQTSFDPDEAEDEPEAASAEEVKSTYSSSRPRWCDILLVEPNASPAVIRKAYARLMKGLHPDIAGGDENTSRQCALVQEAYRQAIQDCDARA